MTITVGGTLVTFNDSTTQPTAGFTGYRNRCVNGSCVIDQKSQGSATYTLTAAIGSGTGRGIDNWVGWYSSSGSAPVLTMSQQTSSPPTGFTRYFRNTLSTTLSSVSMGVRNRIESLATKDLVSQNVTISFYARSDNSTGASGWTLGLAYPTTADTFAASNNTISSTSITLTASWARYTWTVNAGANAANGLEITFNSGTGTATGSFLEITGMQLELGSAATTFEYRNYADELLLCARYAPTFRASTFGTRYFASGYTKTTTSADVWVPFLTQTRVAVSGYLSSTGSNSAFPVINNGGTLVPSGMSFQSSTLTSAGLSVTSAITGSVTAASGCLMYISNNTNVYLLFTGAEL